ncbi:MAG: hypothetical protein HZB71_06235 [Betaproteobacteria bacterium]|nr:hypothetical protein [Betaproteobacteria bacterium]
MISPDTVAALIAQANAAPLDDIAVLALRQAWPGVHITYCSENDIPARLQPHGAGVGYDLYLVSGADHCVAFTDHLEAATGVVLAYRDEDD